MRYITLDVKNSGSLDDVALHLYLIDDSESIHIHKRPMIIVCPGGAYAYTSDREAEIVALQYLSMGYHAAVLRYSVAPAVFPAAVLELGSAVSQIRAHIDEWQIDAERVVVSGFSAGGHVAASYCMFWNQDWVAVRLGTTKEQLRPDGMILGYPVITSGEYAHNDSFHNLLGKDYEAGRRKVSLEKLVGDQVPKAFIWHTYEDGSVPVQNSLLLVNELIKHHIPTEYHIFEKGGHGLSLASRLTNYTGHGPECAVRAWVPLVHQWMENWVAQDDSAVEKSEGKEEEPHDSI